MKKKLIFLLMLGFSVANAGMVNWVVAKVNNEPITNFEVFDTMKKIKTSNQDTALQFLINEKLQASEIKKRDIRVAPYEVTNAIEEIAKKEGKTPEEFKNTLIKQGVNFDEFRSNLAKDIQTQKLLGGIFAKADKKITPESVKQFYESNPMLFMSFESVNATRFAAKTKKEIENVIRGKVGASVYSHKITIPKSSLNEQTAFAFLNMKDGEFTPIMDHPQGFYEVLRIDSKNGVKKVDFETAKDQVFEMFAKNERRKTVDDYFEKLRANAIIEVLPPRK